LPGTAGLPPFISFSTSYPERDSAVRRIVDIFFNADGVALFRLYNGYGEAVTSLALTRMSTNRR
jgi:hypothetical protein